jgi:DNA polymerase-3 subunit epsilon
MTNLGYAVLDFETTGLGADQTDRVIEVAVVLVSPDGTVTDRWESLVNPGRDTGPTHIHGIYNADVRNAPTFEQIAGKLVELLRGRVFVAHSAAFDSRFLAAEFRRAGLVSPVSPGNTVCTMLESKVFLDIDSKSLAACCAATGIVLDDAHRASADAYATALLLGSFLRSHPLWDGWALAQSGARVAVWPELPVAWRVPATRETAASAVSFAHRVTGGTAGLAFADDRIMYLGFVDKCLESFDADPHDVDRVVLFAGVIGLTYDECTELNLTHFRTLAAAAWVGGVLTDAEQRHLVAAARLLAVGSAELTAALRPPAADAEPVALEPGAKIVLTGFSAADKRALGALIEAAGYVVWPSLVKTTGLLVAVDTDSLSSKGRTARRFGVPITDEGGLRALLAAAS